MTEAQNHITDHPNLPGKQPSQAPGRPSLQRSKISGSLQAKLIELAHDAILIRNIHSQMVGWNQGAQTLYGWTEQEALGLTTHQLLQTRFPVSQEAVDQALTEEGSWEGLLHHTSRQGHEVIVESRQVLLRDDAGQPSVILEINRDVTHREQLLQERAQAQAQELAFQETLKQMDQFLGVVSHELRTPVTSLKSMVQLLHRQVQRSAVAGIDGTADYTQKQSDLLQRAERQINRLTRLLDDLLDLSRVRKDRLEFRMEPGDLCDWVQEVVEGEAVAHPGNRIVLEPLPNEALLVVADPDRIGQALTNYLINALKYSPISQPVHVRVWRADGYAHVEVRDQGPGIPLEAQAHLWDLFYRVPGIEVVSGSGVGMGLGLYLCKTLIERHNGQVGVESAPGQGARFWFTLPLAAEHPTES
jgi:PAS domain S-box-containing protein